MSIPVASWLSLSSALAVLGIAVALGGDLERFDGPRGKKTEHAKARAAAERRPATRPSSSPPAISAQRVRAPTGRSGGKGRRTSVATRGNSAADVAFPEPTAPPVPNARGLTAGERRLVNALPFEGRRDFATKRTGGR